MGHRANFVVIRNGSVKAYEDQWAALGCLDGFAAGPEGAVEMLADFKKTTELMDWAFAEGGYLINFDDQTAIVFGSPFDESEFEFDAPDDEAAETQLQDFDANRYLQELAPAWKGWKLVFDDRGTDAFAAYLKSKGIDEIRCQPASHPAHTKPPCELQT